MTSDKRQQILASLQDEEYRREFVAEQVGTGLAFQVRLLRESRGWTQEQLAQRMGKAQETISRWEDPNYGRSTLASLRELAAAFDVALLVRFAPFSELVDWVVNLTPARLAPPGFDEERTSTAVSTAAFDNLLQGFNRIRLWEGEVAEPGAAVLAPGIRASSASGAAARMRSDSAWALHLGNDVFDANVFLPGGPPTGSAGARPHKELIYEVA